jgi:hypothetical protein
MADRHDDLDSWLDGRVEPLPPPPGTFELIKRRARRRKYRRLAVTAGAAAVFVAAAVTVPQVVNLPVLNPTTATNAGNGRASTPAAPTSPASASPTIQSASAPPFPAPVPANFRPSSATFIGTSTGWVIGQAGTPGQCATQYCTSVARTDDAGKTWAGGPAPLAGSPDGGTGVSAIRFLNRSDGWAFGPELFATHDGGHTWTRVATSGLRVTELETVGSRAFGLFASCSGSGTAFADQCTSYTLYSSPAAADDWTPVGAATSGLTAGTGAAGAASLVLTGSRGYLLGPDGQLYGGPVDGSAPWQQVKAAPCPVGAPLADGQPTGALLAAADAMNLVVVCASSSGPGPAQAKTVYTSANGGITWEKAGSGPAVGLATSVADAPDGTVVLATGEGLDVRPAGGTSWQAATLDGTTPKGGFGYVGMTTNAQGIALPANPAAGTIWFTYDGGQTWHPSAVSG